MNNTNVDYFLTVPTPPRTEGPPPPQRARDDAPAFDSLFRQASDASPPLRTTSPSTTPASTQPPAATPTTREQKHDAKPPAEDPVAEDATPCTAECTDQPRDAVETEDEETDDAASDESLVVASAAVQAEPATAEKVAGLVDVEPLVEAVANGKTQPLAKEDRKAQAAGNAAGSAATVQATPESIDSPASSAAAAPDEAVAETAEKPAATKVVAATTEDTVEAAAVDESGREIVPADSQAAEATEPEVEPRAKSKSSRQADAPAAPTVKSERVDEPPQTRTSADHAPVERAVTAEVDQRQVAVAAADVRPLPELDQDSQTSQQKVGHDSSVGEDDSTVDRPRVASVGRVPTLNPTAPVVAVVDQAPPTAVTASTEGPDSEAKTQAVKPAAKEALLSPFARLERGGPLQPHANRVGGERELASHVDPARFVSRVARAVQTAHERGAPLQLRLSPPELGTMRLELAVRDGALTAKIETDNAGARQLLLENLPALRDRLADQSIRIERFDVDVRRDTNGDQAGGRPNSGPQEQGHHRQHTPNSPRTGTGRNAANQAPSDTPSPVRRNITSTSINLVV